MNSSAKRVAEHRANLRAQGLRPVQIWVPDTRGPEYDARIRQQIEALKSDPREQALVRELEEFLDWDDED